MIVAAGCYALNICCVGPHLSAWIYLCSHKRYIGEIIKCRDTSWYVDCSYYLAKIINAYGYSCTQNGCVFIEEMVVLQLDLFCGCILFLIR